MRNLSTGGDQEGKSRNKAINFIDISPAFCVCLCSSMQVCVCVGKRGKE